MIQDSDPDYALSRKFWPWEDPTAYVDVKMIQDSGTIQDKQDNLVRFVR